MNNVIKLAIALEAKYGYKIHPLKIIKSNHRIEYGTNFYEIDLFIGNKRLDHEKLLEGHYGKLGEVLFNLYLNNFPIFRKGYLYILSDNRIAELTSALDRENISYSTIDYDERRE